MAPSCTVSNASSTILYPTAESTLIPASATTTTVHTASNATSTALSTTSILSTCSPTSILSSGISTISTLLSCSTNYTCTVLRELRGSISKLASSTTC